jgi:LacI family transcriptional regulator
VGYPIRELGERAATVLIERIASGSSRDREVVLNAQVIVRESTAAVHAR